jgi:hypothetical protein
LSDYDVMAGLLLVALLETLVELVIKLARGIVGDVEELDFSVWPVVLGNDCRGSEEHQADGDGLE